MNRPRILDLFCCEGGAAAGYARAGFEVTGIDREKRFRKRYPFEFHAANALEYVADHGHEYDAIHASPPCQAYSIATAGNPKARAKHERLIGATREALVASGKPYVIENVERAYSEMRNPVTLCGTTFGLTAIDDDGTPLEMWRHRLFEANFEIPSPGECRHGAYSQQVAGSYGGARRDKHEARYVRKGGYVPAKHIQEQLLGIDWMTVDGLHQSLPPAYTTWVGMALRVELKSTEQLDLLSTGRTK